MANKSLANDQLKQTAEGTTSPKASRRQTRKAEKEHRQAKRNPKPLEARTPTQSEYIKSLRNNELTFGIGPAGVGKAQPLDARIRVPGGWKRMGDIATGDSVLGSDGQPTTVTGVYPQGIRDIYKITFKDGRTVECCEEHLWKVYREDWAGDGWRVVPLSEIRRINSLKTGHHRMYVPDMAPEDGMDVVTPLDPYVVGVLLGDGGLTHGVAVSSSDQFIIDEIRRLIPESCKVNYRSNYDYAIVGDGRHNSVLDAIRSLGMFGKRSYDKRVPPVFLEGSKEQRLHLLQGLMDTDGTVDTKRSSEFNTVSTWMENDVQRLVWSLGGRAKLSSRQTYYTYKGQYKAGAPSYRVRIHLPNLALFRLPRKAERLLGSSQYANSSLRIDAITYSRKSEAQCIAVEASDHLYVTEDFIVTHNTYVPSRVYGEMLANGSIDKLYVARPNVAKAKHRNGYLPGTMEDKTAPWLVPIFEGVKASMAPAEFDYMRREKKIEEVPYEFIQGRTFKNAACIVDEAENLDLDDLYITLTRQVEDLNMVLCGDPLQSRIGNSGLMQVVRMAQMPFMEGVGVIEFSEEDVVRSRQARQWVMAFNRLNLSNVTNCAKDVTQ